MNLLDSVRSSRTTMKILSVPTALLATAVFLPSVDLAASAAAQLGGCYTGHGSGLKITHSSGNISYGAHKVLCMAWNSSDCPSGTSFIADSTTLSSGDNQPCKCATMDTMSCYGAWPGARGARCTPYADQCGSYTPMPWHYLYNDAFMCGTRDSTGARFKLPGGCVQKSSGSGEGTRTQYGYCYSMTTHVATCALHAGHCQGDEKHFPVATASTAQDCPCHKVKVGACKRTKVCPKKCGPSPYSHNAAGAACTASSDCTTAPNTNCVAATGSGCTVDTTVAGYGNIRCVIDSDSCKDDEEYMAPRSTDAASCTLCDESDYKPLAVATTAAAPAATPAPAPAATPAPASSSAAASLPVQGTMLKGLLVCHLVVAMRSFA